MHVAAEALRSGAANVQRGIDRARLGGSRRSRRRFHGRSRYDFFARGRSHGRVHRVDNRVGRDRRARDSVDILAQHQLAGLADELALELVVLRLAAQARSFSKLVIADDDIRDGVRIVQRDFNVHIAAEAGRRHRKASVAQRHRAAVARIQLEAGIRRNRFHRLVHAAHNRLGGDRRRRDRIDFLRVGVVFFAVVEHHGRLLARELVHELRFLGLRAQARRLGEARTADLDAGQFRRVRLRAHGDFHRAAKARHRHLRHVTDGFAVLRSAVQRIDALRLQRFERVRVRHKRLARRFRVRNRLLRDDVFRHLVGQRQAECRDHRNDRQHNPCRQLPLFHLPSLLRIASGQGLPSMRSASA